MAVATARSKRMIEHGNGLSSETTRATTSRTKTAIASTRRKADTTTANTSRSTTRTYRGNTEDYGDGAVDEDVAHLTTKLGGVDLNGDGTPNLDVDANSNSEEPGEGEAQEEDEATLALRKAEAKANARAKARAAAMRNVNSVLQALSSASAVNTNTTSNSNGNNATTADANGRVTKSSSAPKSAGMEKTNGVKAEYKGLVTTIAAGRAALNLLRDLAGEPSNSSSSLYSYRPSDNKPGSSSSSASSSSLDTERAALCMVGKILSLLDAGLGLGADAGSKADGKREKDEVEVEGEGEKELEECAVGLLGDVKRRLQRFYSPAVSVSASARIRREFDMETDGDDEVDAVGVVTPSERDGRRNALLDLVHLPLPARSQYSLSNDDDNENGDGDRDDNSGRGNGCEPALQLCIATYFAHAYATVCRVMVRAERANAISDTNSKPNSKSNSKLKPKPESSRVGGEGVSRVTSAAKTGGKRMVMTTNINNKVVEESTKSRTTSTTTITATTIITTGSPILNDHSTSDLELLCEMLFPPKPEADTDTDTDRIRRREGIHVEQWLTTHLLDIPRSAREGMLKRVYVALTGAAAALSTITCSERGSGNGKAAIVLKLRITALKLMLLMPSVPSPTTSGLDFPGSTQQASPSPTQPSSSSSSPIPIWEQCLKYVSAYARSTSTNHANGNTTSSRRESEEKEKVRVLMGCFRELDELAGLVALGHLESERGRGRANGRENGRERAKRTEIGEKRVGKGWIAFCEYWMALAKRAGDTETLNRVSANIGKAVSSSSGTGSGTEDVSIRVVKACAVLVRFTAALERYHQQGGKQNNKQKKMDGGRGAGGDENDGDDGDDGTQSVLEDARNAISCVSDVRLAVQTQVQTQGKVPRVRMDRKLRRAVERCRKACLNLLGGSGSSSSSVSGGGTTSSSKMTGGRVRVAVREVCEALVGLLDVFSTVALDTIERREGSHEGDDDDNNNNNGNEEKEDDDDDDGDSCTIALLDTLFQLATTGLSDPTNASACDRAYTYLVDAERKVEEVARSISISVEDPSSKGESMKTMRLTKKKRSLKLLSSAYANYTRCLAGAFANIAGMLYRAGRWAFAIRFLRKACPLSVSASAVYVDIDAGGDDDRGGSGDEDREKNKEKDALAWKTHRIQTFRRWELLGVCQSKVGDRKAAREAFVHAVLSFPFSDEDILKFMDTTNPNPPDSTPDSETKAKSSSDTCRAFLNAIEHLTHLSTSELSLETPLVVSSVSLFHPLKNRPGRLPPLLIGAILQRQVQALLLGTGSGRNAKQKRVYEAVRGLLSDLLEVYARERYPVRRAGVLVQMLEHGYYRPGSDGEDEDLEKGSERMMSEVEVLTMNPNDLKEDATLHPMCAYYRVMGLLWRVLHVHRDGGTTAVVLESVMKALGAVDAIFVSTKKILPSAGAGKGSTVRRGGGKVNAVNGRSATRVTKTATSTTTRPVRGGGRSGRVVEDVKTPVTPKPRDGDDSPVSRSTTATATATTYFGLRSSEIKSLAGLMLMVSELLSLLGLGDTKMTMLEKIRQLLLGSDVAESDEYMLASANLSHELLQLGYITASKEVIGPVVGRLLSTSASNITVTASSSSVSLLLRFAEILAVSGDVPQSVAMYERAFEMAQTLEDEDKDKEKTLPMTTRIRARVIALERTALASGVYAAIQESKNDTVASLNSLLQALRLLNRAADTLARLAPAKKPDSPTTGATATPSDDPFAMPEVRNALPQLPSNNDKAHTTPVTTATATTTQGEIDQRSRLDGLEWRIAHTLVSTHLTLSHAYAFRGSAREAEYFAQQAEDLARILGTPALIARALLRKGEVELALGKMEDVQGVLKEVGTLVSKEGQRALGREVVDMHRLMGDLMLREAKEEEAHEAYQEAGKALVVARKGAIGGQKWTGEGNVFMPILQAMILKQQVWLLRDELGEAYMSHLERLLALPQLPRVEVHVNALLGRLALYDIHERFRSDMSLSSLAESIIALPAGMKSEESNEHYHLPQDILDALEQADELFVSDLAKLAERDAVVNVRGAAIAAALVSTYRASLLHENEFSPALVSHLLDMASSITLRRELMEAISFKFPEPKNQDDLQWPSLERSPKQDIRAKGPQRSKSRDVFSSQSDPDNDDNDDDSIDDNGLKQYWRYILQKHRAQAFIPTEDCEAEISQLPPSWVVISISLTDDKNSLLISRQRSGRDHVVFCVPLKGRRDAEEEEHFMFEDAVRELEDIINCSDEGTRRASQIQSGDKEAKAAWWAERKELDVRMKELLENIEFCWLGAFKTILSQPKQTPERVISSLQTRFNKVFRGILGSLEKKSSQKAQINLEPSVLELFSNLPLTCKDEELEDLIYYVLDLYHFHGFPVALAEIDIDHVTVDLRTALEEHHARTATQVEPERDAHMFLVLDKNVQMIPWESLPILRGYSVSRVPSVAFITDRMALARLQKGLPLDVESASRDEEEVEVNVKIECPRIDMRKGYYVLNPSGDLKGTEGRFKPWADGMRKVGWDGVSGRAPSEQQLLNALSRGDLVVYFGHGGGEQYVRSHKVRHLPRCAATMLWGCSSGALRDMGDFDRTGTPNNYMLAGCPALVANLWDVTDRDIDKFAQAVFDKIGLDPEVVARTRGSSGSGASNNNNNNNGGSSGGGGVGNPESARSMVQKPKPILKQQKGKSDTAAPPASLTEAVATSRDVCKLKYLTGAAVVVYGIPLYF